MGQDFIQCYENILEYVTLGEEAIKVSDEKKAVIVIGLTRVGKSTLTQFIANETNPLFVSCAGIICQLIDDSGDGGNSVVSKTFVPNTVEDESTNGVLTPFYDMPGFDDTRNISVEIANSFFIQKVINNIEQVKIVVVAKHASFSSTETTFKTLMTFLIKFAKDPTKFGNSIVIISNFGSYADEDAAHFYNMREYMLAYNESMYGAESSHPDPQERETATAWIRCFLDASDDEPDNLRRAAVFRSPGSRLNGKSIRNDSVYQEDSVRMKQLIWNETLFTPINSSDIGFTLSTEAELFLERATRESDTIIRNHLNGFALRIKAHLEGFIQQMKTAPSKEGMKRLQSHFTTLLNVCFWACNSTIASGPRECVNQIENQLSELAAEMDDMIFTDINKTSNYLQFAYENIGKETEYSMEDWIMSMQGLWYDTNTYFNSNTLEVASKVLNSLENFANDVHNFSLIEFEKLVNNQDQGFLQSLNNTVSELLKMEVFRNCSEENPSSSYLSCFKEIVEKTKLLRELTSNNLDIDLQPSVIFLELACSEVELCLGSANWVDSLVSLKKRVVGSLEEQEIPQNTFNVLLTQLTDAAVKVKSEILHDVPNFVSIADLLNHLLFAKDATEEIARSLESYNSSDSLGGYADLVASAYRKLHNNSVEGVILDRIYVLERLKIFSWFGPVWTIFHRDSLTLPILLEWRVSEFQFQLFNNLGATNVQVGDLGDVHRWRLENPNLQSSNFDQFWDSFESIGVDTVRTFREFRQDIKGHISNNEYSRRWLNELLDYTLKRDQSSCPTVDSSRVVKFERKYMTLRFIYDCLKTYSVKPNIIVALAENTFFFDASFENPGISNKYKIFVMSRNFDYTRGQRIDLNGTDGEHPNQKPAKPTTPSANGIAGRKGNDGKEGADFIGVYLTAIGQPSKLDITSQGGRGGDGQDGGDGADSEDTPGPNLGWHNGQDLGNGQCAAWDDYRILVNCPPKIYFSTFPREQLSIAFLLYLGKSVPK